MPLRRDCWHCGYRADGLRAWKQDANGARIYYLYDGGNPVVEMNSSGTVTNVTAYAPDGLVGFGLNRQRTIAPVSDLIRENGFEAGILPEDGRLFVT